MKNFLATKRVGFVLGSNKSLTWLQATRVLRSLETDHNSNLSSIHLKAVQNRLDLGATIVDRDSDASDSFPGNVDRGQIYRSQFVTAKYEGFELLLSFTFTVCVELSSPLNNHRPHEIRSKFWYSAFINCSPNKINDEDFVRLCEKIDDLAQNCLKDLRPIYRKSINQVNSEVNLVKIDRNVKISDILIQIDDQNFRECLDKLRHGKIRLSNVRNSAALKYLNKLYSGDHVRSFLHFGRNGDDQKTGALLNTRIQSDPLLARAFYIETLKAKPGKNLIEMLSIGVTSSSEPNRKSDSKSKAYNTTHEPCSAISGVRVAEIGERF